MKPPYQTHMRTEPRPKWHDLAAFAIGVVAYIVVAASAVAVVWLVSCL